MSHSDQRSKISNAKGDLPPTLPALARTFRLGYRAEPRLLSTSLVLALLMMAPDALFAVALKTLIDGALQENSARVRTAGLALAVLAIASWFLSVVYGRVQRRFRDRVAIALESHVATLQASVATVEHHERPEYLDRLAMLRDQVFTLDHLFMALFSTLGWIFRLVITVAILASIHPALALLAVAAIPAVWVSTWRPAVERVVEEAAIVHQRLARHLFVLGTTASPAKELRVTGSTSWLVDQRRSEWQRWYTPVASARVATGLWEAAAWAIFGGAYVAAIVFVTEGLDRSVGSVVLVLAAGARLARYVGATAGELGFLRGFWLDSSRRLAWLEDYAASFTPVVSADVPTRLDRGIEFENVSFRYPGTDRLILDDVNLVLPAGAVVAVIGENGAGKSTLVKLLARMYSPTAGRITADGVDLAQMHVDEWRSRLAGAFQDFYRFEFHAQHTVGIGDLDRLDDRPGAESAVERAGAGDVVERLPDGLDTQLGPTWEDGADLSFGQWQKLALARGLMREEPLLLVLDEPTAALDAETEHALFERFASASRSAGSANGRVAVLVSHRFSTVRMADVIVVLDGSRVAEVGTHDELMARQGQYAQLYSIQAKSYAR